MLFLRCAVYASAERLLCRRAAAPAVGTYLLFFAVTAAGTHKNQEKVSPSSPSAARSGLNFGRSRAADIFTLSSLYIFAVSGHLLVTVLGSHGFHG